MKMLEQFHLTLKRLNIAFAATDRYKPVSQPSKNRWKGIQSYLPERQKEFFTARWCAGKCLNMLGLDGHPSILTGKNGEPLWPEGVTGSISHSKGAFCASAALISNYSSLGIDIESIGNKISDDAFRLIVNNDETDWMSRIHDNIDFFKLIVFSAKESLFKLLFPLVKKRFYFNAVSIFPVPSRRQGNLTAVLNESLHPDYRKGQHFEGNYFSDKKWLLTAFYIKNNSAL